MKINNISSVTILSLILIATAPHVIANNKIAIVMTFGLITVTLWSALKKHYSEYNNYNSISTSGDMGGIRTWYLNVQGIVLALWVAFVGAFLFSFIITETVTITLTLQNGSYVINIGKPYLVFLSVVFSLFIPFLLTPMQLVDQPALDLRKDFTNLIYKGVMILSDLMLLTVSILSMYIGMLLTMQLYS